MTTFLTTAIAIASYLLALTAGLHILARLGPSGRRILDSLSKAPALDGVIVAYQVLPLAAGAILGGWAGLAGALAGCLIAYFVWVIAHEYHHRELIRKGPRIVTTLNRIVGSSFRQQTALWTTTLAFPAFWLIRLAEIVVYPVLVWGINLPPYKSGDWVAISRHKFEGLVGHDRLWCLYCDWMTGVYSLGAEMLRNLESFWCPIKFQSGSKCANCKLDFPDIENGWVPHDGTMADVAALLEAKYADTGSNSWYGHQNRRPPPVRVQTPERKKETADT
ncbi:hypothetical protein K1W69_02015 [Hoeflea sp. WL0058]|uniref:Uncharacterized protein n=1 Tax=Flavimaribacter sediminis TaxID=2865987 RepID=A0AAE3CY89_9HYPH|nr:hypothetical protein [Flavimaribacter sediminis]MBW8635945.1 hypothetical protein [Flavimaribacter sediminis]